MIDSKSALITLNTVECRRPTSLIEATNQMPDLADKLASISDECSELKEQIKKKGAIAVLKQLKQSVEAISKSWCGSWMGYHSRVYYKDLQPVPPGARFDSQWGFQGRFSNGTDGEWCEYDFDKVYKAVKSVVNPNKYDSIVSLGSKTDEKVRDLRENALSVLEAMDSVSQDSYLTRLIDDVKKISPIFASSFIQDSTPRGFFMSHDRVANQSGLQPPPHLVLWAEVAALRSVFDTVDQLAKSAERGRKHLMNRSLIKSNVNAGTKVFIGHGKTAAWRDLKDFVKERLNLPFDEFNRVSVAGKPTVTRLQEMLDGAAFAFLVMTAEDEQLDGTKHARMNVIHEAGLFQGRLGFDKAIVVLEESCEEFSNIEGLGQIRFPKGNIKACFEEVRQVLEREGILPS